MNNKSYENNYLVEIIFKILWTTKFFKEDKVIPLLYHQFIIVSRNEEPNNGSSSYSYNL